MIILFAFRANMPLSGQLLQQKNTNRELIGVQ